MDEIHMIMRGNHVTGWSPDKKFARACAGKGERVVTFIRARVALIKALQNAPAYRPVPY